MSRRTDAGAAAVELALCLVLLLSVALLVAPLPLALAQQTRVEQAAGYTARWASSVPGGVRPSVGALVTVASTAFGDTVTASSSEVAQGRCATRRAVVVTVTATQGLGPLGRLAGRPTTVLTASASSCKE